MKEFILCLILLSSMAFTFYLTKPKTKKSCDNCKDDCSKCNAFQNFYEDYKRDQEKER